MRLCTRSRFWTFSAFAGAVSLTDLWQCRSSLSWNFRSRLAVLTSELANGDILAHPWTAEFSDEELAELLVGSVANAFYILFRSDDVGIGQQHFVNAIAHIIIACLLRFECGIVAQLIERTMIADNGGAWSPEVRNHLMIPPVRRAALEVTDVCVEDCIRVVMDSRVMSNGELKNYWDRFTRNRHVERQLKERYLIVESNFAPCQIGFSVSPNKGCPLLR